MKPSFRYATGEPERLRAKEVVSTRTFTQFARQMLGVEIPIGQKYRSQWYGRLKEEMEIQGWRWSDLANTVVYLSNHPELPVKRIAGVFYYVREARKYGYLKQTGEEELRAKVSEAISRERDEHWVRRLSLATGPAMAAVYAQWLERMEAHEV